MIKENVLEIKRLVSDLHCMGTYGMVELELNKIENYVKELEGKVKNLTIPRVSQQSELLKAFYLYIDDKWALGMLTDKVDEVIEGFEKSL